MKLDIYTYNGFTLEAENMPDMLWLGQMFDFVDEKYLPFLDATYELEMDSHEYINDPDEDGYKKQPTVSEWIKLKRGENGFDALKKVTFALQPDYWSFYQHKCIADMFDLAKKELGDGKRMDKWLAGNSIATAKNKKDWLKIKKRYGISMRREDD